MRFTTSHAAHFHTGEYRNEEESLRLAYLKKLGKNINRIRLNKKYSIDEMSLLCDVERFQLIKLMEDGYLPEVSLLLRISKGINVPLSEIFDFNESN